MVLSPGPVKVKDLVDERFSARECSAISEIDEGFSRRLNEAENYMVSRSMAFTTSLTDSEKRDFQDRNLADEVNLIVEDRLKRVDVFVDSLLDMIKIECHTINRCDFDEFFVSALEQAGTELSHFHSVSSLLSRPKLFDLLPHGAILAPVKELIGERSDQVIHRLRELDFEIGYHVNELSGLSLSKENFYPRPGQQSSLKTRCSALELEISHLRMILRRLSRAENSLKSIDAVLQEIDAKYLHWIGELSTLIFQIVCMETALPSKQSLWVFSKVLPIMLTQSDVFMDMISTAVDEYLADIQDRNLQRIIQYELKRIARIHRSYFLLHAESP